jgi:hypothetical protein
MRDLSGPPRWLSRSAECLPAPFFVPVAHTEIYRDRTTSTTGHQSRLAQAGPGWRRQVEDNGVSAGFSFYRGELE